MIWWVESQRLYICVCASAHSYLFMLVDVLGTAWKNDDRQIFNEIILKQESVTEIWNVHDKKSCSKKNYG